MNVNQKKVRRFRIYHVFPNSFVILDKHLSPYTLNVYSKLKIGKAKEI